MTDLPSTMSMSICDEGHRCDDDDEELAAATTTATWLSLGYWVWFWFVYWGFFFFFDKHLCALCLVCWVLCLVCFCIGDWSLCQRRHDVMGFCQAPATWWVQFLILCIFFFFLIENLWACCERATCNGLAVSKLLVMGSPWAWFLYIYIYIYIFFFSDFSSNFFWVFFF